MSDTGSFSSRYEDAANAKSDPVELKTGWNYSLSVEDCYTRSDRSYNSDGESPSFAWFLRGDSVSFPEGKSYDGFYLQEKWNFWCETNASSHEKRKKSKAMQSKRNYLKRLQKIPSFDTFAGFVNTWNGIVKEQLPFSVCLYLFRNGVRPLWEENPAGGKLILQVLPKGNHLKGLALYLRIATALLCNDFGDQNVEYVKGITISLRSVGAIISIWNETASEKGQADYIRTTLCSMFGLSTSQFSYKPFQKTLTSLKKNGKRYRKRRNRSKKTASSERSKSRFRFSFAEEKRYQRHRRRKRREHRKRSPEMDGKGYKTSYCVPVFSKEPIIVDSNYNSDSDEPAHSWPPHSRIQVPERKQHRRERQKYDVAFNVLSEFVETKHNQQRMYSFDSQQYRLRKNVLDVIESPPDENPSDGNASIESETKFIFGEASNDSTVTGKSSETPGEDDDSFITEDPLTFGDEATEDLITDLPTEELGEGNASEDLISDVPTDELMSEEFEIHETIENYEPQEDMGEYGHENRDFDSEEDEIEYRDVGELSGWVPTASESSMYNEEMEASANTDDEYWFNLPSTPHRGYGSAVNNELCAKPNPLMTNTLARVAMLLVLFLPISFYCDSVDVFSA